MTKGSKERLREFLSNKKLTQNELAESIGMTQSGITSIINGRAYLQKKHTILLKATYNLNPDWLLHGTEPMYLPHENKYDDPRQLEVNQAYESVEEPAKVQIYEAATKLQQEHINRQKQHQESKKYPGFSKEDFIASVMIPVLGIVPAGSPKVVYSDTPLEYFPAPILEKEKNQFFWVKVSGDSMIDCGIKDKDMVLLEKKNSIPNNQVCLVRVNDEFTLKIFRHYEKTQTVTLTPCNPDYPVGSHPDEQVEVFGVKKYVLSM